MAANEKNRATIVALNAEIRRIKARLMDEVPKLQRLALKKVQLCYFIRSASSFYSDSFHYSDMEIE